MRHVSLISPSSQNFEDYTRSVHCMCPTEASQDLCDGWSADRCQLLTSRINGQNVRHCWCVQGTRIRRRGRP